MKKLGISASEALGMWMEQIMKEPPSEGRDQLIEALRANSSSNVVSLAAWRQRKRGVMA